MKKRPGRVAARTKREKKSGTLKFSYTHRNFHCRSSLGNIVGDLDIRLISLISGFWIRSKHGCFQWFFKFFTLWLLSTDIWLLSSRYFLIFCQKLLDVKLKFAQFSLDIRVICLWHPADILDILISVVQIFSKMLSVDSNVYYSSFTEVSFAVVSRQILASWNIHTSFKKARTLFQMIIRCY